MPRALLGLGSNLGDRGRTLDEALAAVGRLPGTTLVAQSAWYETSPVGGPMDQPPFLNGCAMVTTSLPPERLLDGLLAVEGAAGRVRTAAWGPRTLDLDLLLYDDAVIRSERLRVPHPRLAFRKFVLRGAKEIAADWRHPLLERTLGDLARHLETAPAYVATVGLPQGFRTQFAGEAADAGRARLVDATAAGVPATVEEVVRHGLTATTAIEFLRARQAAIERSLVDAAGAWIVDDAWLADEAAELARWLDDGPRRTFLADWRALRSSKFEPRLLLCLGTKSTGPHAAALVVAHAMPADVALPPVVDVDIGDREAALVEIAAALEAAA
jgi:2-amino-4-hydroxy-6-hydroxymethyldihydropteridine diphosphokinase